MIPHFILQRGKQEYLIFKTEDAFHLIDCNEALTKEKREAILESGCTPEKMQEMGLSGTTIARAAIECITVTGCGFQDDVIFYLGKRKKLCYWFPKAYEQKRVDDFFRGIPRKQVKSRRRLKGGRNMDWRLKEQDEAMYRKLRPVGWVFNILCVLIALSPFVIQGIRLRHYGWITMGVCLIALGLDFFYPAYFSIQVFAEKDQRLKRRNKYGQKMLKTRAIQLGYGLLAVIVMFIGSCRNLYVIDYGRLVIVTLIATVVISVLLLVFIREFGETLKENAPLYLVTMMIAFIFNFISFIPFFNHAFGGELTPFTASIIDKHISSGKSTTCYYTVDLPDGRELDFPVTRVDYEAAELGDIVELEYGTGFFGIEYAIDG